MRSDILDLSSNNALVDFEAAALSGVQAVLHKATEGVGYVDPLCRIRCVQAKANGLRVGAYHYLRIRAGKPQDAKQQAIEYLSVWGKVDPDLLPCVDVETALNEHSSPAENCAAVTEFVSAIEDATGVSPIIYTSRGEWQSMGLSSLTSLARCPLWLAAYGAHATAPGPWLSFVAWQWTGSGSCPGVIGPCDLSEAEDLGALMMPM